MVWDTASQTWESPKSLSKATYIFFGRETSIIFPQVILLEMWESLVEKKRMGRQRPNFKKIQLHQVLVMWL